MATEDVFGIVGTTQAGNFHVEEAVAQGGFGVVYRAQHGGFRAPVALKCLKIPEELSQAQREVFLGKFREEAELLFRLSAAIPEVVRPLHVDVLDGKLAGTSGGGFVPFLAMEWLDGESLDAIIKKRATQGQPPLGLHKLIKLLRPVVHALARAHRFKGPQGAESIVHRDLKPENIFVAIVCGAESVKILDFGIAKARRLASEAAGRLTGQVMDEDESSSFTPAYGAPEQWAPKRFGVTGPWTDVWGMALTLVEALIGGPAIDGDTYAMRRLAIDEKKRPTPRTLGATVPDAVEQAFERAMAVDPRKRTRDLELFWTELERAAGLPASFTPRDSRREEGEESVLEEEITGPSTSRASTPSPQVPAGARLARIELQRVERPLADRPSSVGKSMGDRPSSSGKPAGERPSSSGRQAGEWPSSSRKPPGPPPEGPASSDFSDVFVPSERAPTPAPLIVPEIRPRRPLDSREFDLEMTSSIRPAPSAREVDLQEASASRRASIDLEVSLPTESARGSSEPKSEPRVAPAPVSVPAVLAPAPVLPAPPPRDPRPPKVEEDLDIDLVAPPRSRPVSAPLPPLSPHAQAAGNLRAPPRSGETSEMQSLRARIGAPLAVLSLAIAISAIEFATTRITGTPLMIGPVRPFWIAAPLALFGVAFTLWRFMGDRDDG